MSVDTYINRTLDVVNAHRLMEVEVINENTVTRSVPLTSCK